MKLQASAEGLGFSLPADLLPSPEPACFEVMAENWSTVDLFLRCQTQWRLRPDGRLAGLDYQAVLAMATLYQVAAMPDVMERLQVIEHTILKEQP